MNIVSMLLGRANSPTVDWLSLHDLATLCVFKLLDMDSLRCVMFTCKHWCELASKVWADRNEWKIW